MRRTILRNMCALLLLTLAVAYGLFCFMLYEETVDTVKQQLQSEAIFLETPINKAPKIVAPEREVPGNTAAIT